ncbi:hypothetical protein MJN69_29865, partial [Salmonella enterica subsp. enterica serovar Kentucky]|nr:hypothetical protein [Salmonella enterica subsp. enterica serovar Kentucky]
GYLLYLGIPTFLNINREEGLSFSSSTLAIGVLVLEVLLAITVRNIFNNIFNLLNV